MNFGSDNETGASPRVLDALVRANGGAEAAYGDDAWTARAVAALRDVFGCDLDAFFVPTGTAANGLALSCLAQPWQAVLCHNQAHILMDESTGPEFFTGGARPIGISGGDGKLRPGHLDDHFASAGNHPPHNPAAGALSLTQVSENGLVYAPEEIRALTAAAKARGLTVHMDGARFANAVAALGCAPADISWKAGVDVLCLGATKNGGLAAEAVVFFNRSLAASFIHRRKRAGHLLSKGRFLGAQFVGWLEKDHWLDLARTANARAAQLARGLAALPGVQLAWPVQANEVFAVVPDRWAADLRAAGAAFFDWYPAALRADIPLQAGRAVVRFVASFATEEADVQRFLAAAGARP